MEDKSMSEQYMTTQLVAEFHQLTQRYNQALADLPRRNEIVFALVCSGLSYRKVAKMLGISAPRVGQLIKEAPGYVPPAPPAN